MASTELVGPAGARDHRWLARPVRDAELVAAYRANALVDAHRDDPKFGYRFLIDEAHEASDPTTVGSVVTSALADAALCQRQKRTFNATPANPIEAKAGTCRQDVMDELHAASRPLTSGINPPVRGRSSRSQRAVRSNLI
ncbi:hypothetical protein [Micromonospora sp. NPDC049282]|uniref:hypothetical protein n=1 Tax=Micromonospora sp. NPDC049282 TaxID=3364269 RepID=UPI003718C291